MNRRAPITPVPGVTLHDFRVGDRIIVPISGRTGTIDRRCKQPRDGWIVRWDEPVFGVTEGRVAIPNMAPLDCDDCDGEIVLDRCKCDTGIHSG